MVARSLLVVEDHALTRSLLVMALTAQGYEVFSAADAVQALEMNSALDPDGVILDVNLGGGANGFELAEQFRRVNVILPIVFLTSIPDPRLVGSDSSSLTEKTAYLTKSSLTNLDVLFKALDLLIAGRPSSQTPSSRTSAPGQLVGLTSNQLRTLSHVVDGLSNAEIAQTMGVTPRAVAGTVQRIAQRLGVDQEAHPRSRSEIVKIYLAHLTRTS